MMLRATRGARRPPAPIQLATQIAIVQQPSALSTSGVPFSVQPSIEVRDANGVRVAGYSGTVTVSVVSGTSTLVGSTTATIANGAATFSGLGLQIAIGTDINVLRFSVAGLATASSSNVACSDAPYYRAGTDTLIHQGDSTNFRYLDAYMAGSAGTWRANTDVVAGVDRVCCGNIGTGTDLQIDASDPTVVTRATPFTSGFLGISFTITSGANFDPAILGKTLYVVSVGGTGYAGAGLTGAMQLSLTRWGDPVSLGTVGGPADGHYNYIGDPAHGYYVCSQSGKTGTAGGPTGTGTGIIDGTAKWDYISDPRTDVHLCPGTSRMVQPTPIDPIATIVTPGYNGAGKGLSLDFINTGNQWQPDTLYPKGTTVYNGSDPTAGSYTAVVGGRSAPSGTGPSGAGYRIADNTVVWQCRVYGTLQQCTQNGEQWGLYGLTSVPPASNTIVWGAYVKYTTADPTDAAFAGSSGGLAYKDMRLPTKTQVGGAAPQWSSHAADITVPSLHKSYFDYYAKAYTDTGSGGDKQGQQSIGPYPIQMANGQYRFTLWLWRSSSGAGLYDGRAAKWIEDPVGSGIMVKVQDICTAMIGQTPPGGEKPYCGTTEVHGTDIVNDQIADITKEALNFVFGGIMSSQPTPPINETVDIDSFRAWAQPTPFP